MHIKKLHIQNFKSIKDLKIDANRVNVFIGEPNTGKSNILEALSFFSLMYFDNNVFNEIFRFKTIEDLFYNSNVSSPIEINTDMLSFHLSYNGKAFKSKDSNYSGYSGYSGYSDNSENLFTGKLSPKSATIKRLLKGLHYENFQFNLNGITSNINEKGFYFLSPFRPYIFKKIKSFGLNHSDFLNPPFGDNLPNLLQRNDELREIVSDMFKDKGYKLQLKPVGKDMEMSVEINGVLYSYPYYSISETLQRIIFLVMAIESNKHTILLLDEPESNTFPFYTKYIAERIALDKTNQYFITTHNPYLLLSLIEKTPSKDLNVFVTKLKDYQTKAYRLNQKQLIKAVELQSDIFFNLDRLVK